MHKMTKKYIVNTLSEEKLWKEGESDSFVFGKWNLTLRKEEGIYHPFIYAVRGVHENGTWSRRYTSMEKAFLHIVNGFNENANIKNNYETIGDFIERGKNT